MPDKNKYLLFGGVSHQRFSDLYTLDAGNNKTNNILVNFEWTHIEATGKNPKEISHCVGWYDGK